MRVSSILPVLLASAALAACERESQQLPFSAEGAGTVARTVPTTGATVSSPAGASVQIPAGAVSAPVEVRLTPVPAPAVARSGASASAGFQLEPAGTPLAQPASVGLAFDASADPGRAWLASLVNVTPSGVREIGETRVDLSTGSVSGEIDELGTLAVVIPDPKAVFQVRRGGERSLAPGAPRYDLAATGTDSVVVRCGDEANRCEGVSVTASANLLEKVENAAAVYPRIDGVLRISGTSVSGRIDLATSLRAQLEATSENVVINGSITPTAGSVVSESAGSLTFSAMRHAIRGSADSGSQSDEVVTTLEISKSGTPTVTITRSFQIDNSAGEPESASVSVSFPVQIHQ